MVTQSSFDKITTKTNYQNLVKLYGASNLKEDFYIGEGPVDDTTWTTTIYPGTYKEITVYWQRELFHKKISSVESFQKQAPYFTKDGLKIGSTLKKLLQVNQKKITFLGFGWDYGGMIESFNNGKLEKSIIKFWLDAENEVADRIVGDKEFHTDLPLVKKKLDYIFISKISLSFEE